jgi:hypothetical protein
VFLDDATREGVRLLTRPRVSVSRVTGLAPPDLTIAFLDRLRALVKGRLIVKGIVTGEDAGIAVEHGADGIVVSNHGGRNDPLFWPRRALSSGDSRRPGHLPGRTVPIPSDLLHTLTVCCVPINSVTAMTRPLSNWTGPSPALGARLPTLRNAIQSAAPAGLAGYHDFRDSHAVT